MSSATVVVGFRLSDVSRAAKGEKLLDRFDPMTGAAVKVRQPTLKLFFLGREIDLIEPSPVEWVNKVTGLTPWRGNGEYRSNCTEYDYTDWVVGVLVADVEGDTVLNSFSLDDLMRAGRDAVATLREHGHKTSEIPHMTAWLVLDTSH